MPTTIDVARYLQPLSADNACGPNLEYDPGFGELERLAAGKPEQVEGDQVIAKAEDPPWREVFGQAEALLARSRDIRVAIHLTHAGLNLVGIEALAAGLALIDGLLRTFWEQVHPLLDEGDKDPTLRINSLSELESPPPPGSRPGPYLLRSLDRVPLVRSAQAGAFAYRDVKLARGDITPGPAEKGSVPQLALIEAAFQESDLEALQVSAQAVGGALATLKALRDYLRSQVGAERAPGFAILEKELQGIQRLFAEQLSRRGVGAVALAAGSPPEGAAAAAGGALVGEIRTREDVVKILRWRGTFS